jgi:hypothetical protein
MEIIKLQQFQNDFNLIAEKSPTKPLVIKTVIKEIDDYVSFDITQTDKKSRKIGFYVKPKPLTIFNINIPSYLRDVFSEAFKSYLTYGNYNLEKFPNEENENFEKKLKTIEQAFEVFTYYKWLNELLTAPEKSNKKHSLSHKQIIIALHYLGFDMQQFNQIKTGLILGEILGLDAKNTTDYIRHASLGKNNVRTPENLEKVKQLFEKHGLNEVSDKINPEKPRE